MKEKRISQAALARASGLSRTTISRIYRNCNDKGSTWQPESFAVVKSVCIGLGVYDAEKQRRLFFAAFPELAAWEYIDEKEMNMIDANIYLDEMGLPLLGGKNDS